MAQTNCKNCGANITRAVCEYCGTLAVPQPSILEQREALELLHSLITSKPLTEQNALIRQAFLPDDPDVLIEAGLRSLQMLPLRDNDHTEAVLARLRSIMVKLKLASSTPKIQQALISFEKEIKAHKKQTATDIMWGLGIFILLPLVVIGTIVYFWLVR